MAQIRCQACGWENEAGARICGGCGRPLAGAAGPMRYPSRGAGAGGEYGAHGATGETDPDMPTVRDLPPYPQGYASGYQSSYQSGYAPDYGRSAQRGGAAAARWSAAPQYRRTSPAGRIAIGALIAVALLALVGATVWAALLRPQLHQRADTALRAQLSSMVVTFNRLPAVPTTNLSVTGDEASAGLQAGISSDVPVQNLHVTFQGGRTIVTYTAYGFSGTVSTSLVAVNGRLAAQDTAVDGPMGLVESSSELQAALSDALANLRHDITVKQVSEQNNTLTVSVKGTV